MQYQDQPTNLVKKEGKGNKVVFWLIYKSKSYTSM